MTREEKSRRGSSGDTIRVFCRSLRGKRTRRLARVERAFGASGRSGHDRHTNAVDDQFGDPGRPAPLQLLPKPLGEKFESGEHIVERGLPLEVKHPRREHPAIHLPHGPAITTRCAPAGELIHG